MIDSIIKFTTAIVLILCSYLSRYFYMKKSENPKYAHVASENFSQYAKAKSYANLVFSFLPLAVAFFSMMSWRSSNMKLLIYIPIGIIWFWLENRAEQMRKQFGI